MPDSLHDFDGQIKDWVFKNYPPNSSILDVGPGLGKFSRLLRCRYQMLDCVEIFRPYITKYRLNTLYYNVFNCSIVDFKYIEEYDLVIIGDVLEHLSIEDAKKVLARCKTAIVQVPYLYEQGILEDNPAEIHLQPDLTPEVMKSRYSMLSPLFPVRQKLGVYICRKGT